nr:DUF4283 domain-containing protein [Ipomoea batatas]
MAVTQNSEEMDPQGNDRQPTTDGGKKRDSSQNHPKAPWTDLFKQSKETVDSSLKLKFCPPKNGTAILEEHEKRDYARMLVEIDSSIPPVESIPILLPNGETLHQAVYFEQYPCFCVNCKSSKHWVENCPKLKGIPPADSAFPPLKIVDCKRNGNEWRWNKEELSPESVEPNTVIDKPVEGSSDSKLASHDVVTPNEPVETKLPTEAVCEGEQRTEEVVCEREDQPESLASPVNSKDSVSDQEEVVCEREDQPESLASPVNSKVSVSDKEEAAPSTLTAVPLEADLDGSDDEIEVIPRSPPVGSPCAVSPAARFQWDEVPNFMPLFTTHLPSFGPFAFDKDLIAYQLKANKAHEEFVAFQKEANRVCKEFVAMKKGSSVDLSPTKSAAVSPPKAFDFRAALLSPSTQGSKVRNSSKVVPNPLRAVSLSRSKGRKRPGASVQ